MGKKISELTQATSVTGNEMIPFEMDGGNGYVLASLLGGSTSEDNIYVVNLTYSGTGETAVYTADKTAEEIYNAVTAGKTIVGIYDYSESYGTYSSREIEVFPFNYAITSTQGGVTAYSVSWVRQEQRTRWTSDTTYESYGCIAFYAQTGTSITEDKVYEISTSSSDGSSITVDTALSSTSENPVQNKVIYAALQGYATQTWVGNQGYLTSHQDISGKVDKEDGKGLSTNDYTTAEKTKLGNIESYTIGEGLTVENGVLKCSFVPTRYYTGSTDPINTSGNNGDLYLQISD